MSYTLKVAFWVFVAVVVAEASRHVLYNRQAFPKEWNLIGRASPNNYHEFYLALYQQRVHLLEKMLYDVSHPKSPHYGEHYTYSEIMDVIAPPKEHVDFVIEWLVKGGVSPSEIRSRGDALIVRTTVKNIESLFQTEMHIFEHSVKQRQIIAHLGESSIPLAVKNYVEMVTGLSFFPPPKKLHDMEAPKQQNTPWLIPNQLKKIYNIPLDLQATNPKTSQAAVEFEWPGCFNYTDMKVYQELVGAPFFTNVTRVIPEDEVQYTACDGESALDLQMMLTIGSGAQTAYFTNEFWIYEFALTLMGLPNPPLVTSLSWGWMEADTCQSITNAECQLFGNDPFTYVNRTNVELLKAGNMGLTVLVCTQDEGAPSDNNEDCTLDDTSTPVWPIFPASSPWVTAVGSTTVYNANAEDHQDREMTHFDMNKVPLCQQIMCNNATDEKVAMCIDQDTLFTSGGGFSNWTARPTYQDSAVKAYLASDGIRPPKGTFGENNRAYPDISTAGCQVFNLQNGAFGWEGGTSMSTPVFAGIVSLLNDWRLNNGKSPLGFLNYLLYEMGTEFPQAYNYITVGNNTCTGWYDNICCKYGYSAIAGWNPAVGFGTPNFQQILSYIKKLN